MGNTTDTPVYFVYNDTKGYLYKVDRNGDTIVGWRVCCTGVLGALRFPTIVEANKVAVTLSNSLDRSNWYVRTGVISIY